MKNSQSNSTKVVLTNLFKRKNILMAELRQFNKDIKAAKQEQKNVRRMNLIQIIRQEGAIS